MDLKADLDLGAGLRLRTLTVLDVDLVVGATACETAPALWGPRPAGPYMSRDARVALEEWDADAGGQTSYGILGHGRLLGALGLMPDGPHSAELAYWVRPESRRQGLALNGINALTHWAHGEPGFSRVWLEINPGNAPSLGLAARAGFVFEQRIANHCRGWTTEEPERDTWHDCLIWVHADNR